MARPKEEILSRVKYTVSASKAESMVWGMAKEMTESPAGGAAVAAAFLCPNISLYFPAEPYFSSAPYFLTLRIFSLTLRILFERSVFYSNAPYFILIPDSVKIVSTSLSVFLWTSIHRQSFREAIGSLLNRGAIILYNTLNS